jgi:hypothetical protein
VINTASLSALRGIAPGGQVAHAAAKGGVVSFTTAIAAEGEPMRSGQTPFHQASSGRLRPTPPWMMGSELS